MGDREIWGRDICVDLCEWVNSMKIFVSYVNAQTNLSRGGF